MMTTRRRFLKTSAVAMGGALVSIPADAAVGRKMKLCLSPGAIGVKAGPREVLALAHEFGFEAIEPSADFLARLSAEELAAFRADMKEVVFGAAGFPVEFRGNEPGYAASLAALPERAKALQRAGIVRVSTWISPSHNDLPREQNFEQHARRLRESAKILLEHDLRLGLEYVGTPTLRAGRKNPFIHSMREMQELIAAIGTGNVGLVLDSWHWWTSQETEQDILRLKASDVVSVDLNDAPAGIPLERQQDGQRELPCATNVIPAAAFLNALQRIGYDGPIRAEPFNRKLNEMDDRPACAATIAALRKAMALIA